MGNMQRSWDLIERLARLFGDVEDMADMDAADFKDNAGEIWAMRQEARIIVEEGG